MDACRQRDLRQLRELVKNGQYIVEPVAVADAILRRARLAARGEKRMARADTRPTTPSPFGAVVRKRGYPS